MSRRGVIRKADPMEGLGSSETEVLSIGEERELLRELTSCKAKLAKALESIPQDEGMAAEGSGEVHPSRRMAFKSSQDATLGVTYRRFLEIRAKLALANMRLVAHVAKKFRERGISYSDLIQEGFQGLLEAIDRFDLSHGTKLATYATWWIRQSMQQAVASGAYPVRLTPRHLRQLAQSQQEQSGSFNAENVVAADRGPAEMTDRIRAATRPAISLDSRSDCHAGFNLLEALGDSTADRITEIDAGETVGRLMDVLGPREREVLSMRFGLGGLDRLSLSQTGDRLKVSKERIRQIQDRAIEKLRTVAREQNLQEEFPPSDRSDLRAAKHLGGDGTRGVRRPMF